MFRSVDALPSGPIVWLDCDSAASSGPVGPPTSPALASWNDAPRHHEPAVRVDGPIHRATRPLTWLGARLIAPPGDDLRRWHSMDVTCRVGRSAADAVEALGRTAAIEWGDGRRPSRLSIERIRRERSGLGGPRLADAVVRGRRTGPLDMTIAIFEGSRDTCVVQLRRSGRSTWGLRRRRRCMTATHDAADRLTELILAVDFRPPVDPD